MKWITEKSEYDSRQKQDMFFLHSVRTASGVHTATYSMGFTPEVKGLGHEADTEIENVWSYTSTPPHMSIAWCLVQLPSNLIPTNDFLLFVRYTFPDCYTYFEEI
jgi:hypothetical protein